MMLLKKSVKRVTKRASVFVVVKLRNLLACMNSCTAIAICMAQALLAAM